MSNIFGDVVYAYTRANALEDGVLVDVSEVAREAGFRLPVAVTTAIWEKYIVWGDSDTEKQAYQDESGRLWDVLFMLRMAINRCKDENVVQYRLRVIPRDGKSKRPVTVVLKAQIHGGDECEPVITVMLPNED